MTLWLPCESTSTASLKCTLRPPPISLFSTNSIPTSQSLPSLRLSPYGCLASPQAPPPPSAPCGRNPGSQPAPLPPSHQSQTPAPHISLGSTHLVAALRVHKHRRPQVHPAAIHSAHHLPSPITWPRPMLQSWLHPPYGCLVSPPAPPPSSAPCGHRPG